MSKTTRTSKKQIHELEAMARETIDKRARLYARNEYDATGKAYAVINGTRTAYASNTALYDAVADMVLTKQAEEFQSEPERIMQNVAGHTIYKHTSGSEIYYTVSDVEGLEFWTVAEARHYAQCSPTAESLETIAAATAAALQAAEKAEQAKAETLAAREAGDESAAAKHAQEAATYAQAASKASSDAYHANGNRVNATAHEADIRANEAASIAIRAYYETREDLAAAEAAAPAAFNEYANCEDLVNAIAYDAFEARDAPRPTYQRAELLAYLGEPDDYDIAAIEHEATAYDTATGRTVWAVDAETLAAIAERHQLQFYAPAF